MSSKCPSDVNMIPRPVSLLTELMPSAGVLDSAMDSVCGTVPGGWICWPVEIAGRRWQLTIPGQPDALLDDSEVIAASHADDRMPYWAYVWPASVPMIDAVLHSDWPEGSRILELGCGIGLLGLAALQMGHHVTLTDYEPQSVALARHNAIQNGYTQFEARQLDWREPPNEQFPIVIGCDLLYQDNHFKPLLHLLRNMLQQDGVCWLGDAGRSTARHFWEMLQEDGFDVTLLNSEGRILSAPTSEYQLFIIRHRADRSGHHSVTCPPA